MSKPTEEFLECLDVLMMRYFGEEVDDDLLNAALWQTADIGMSLLFEHMQALDDIKKLEHTLEVKAKQEDRLWRPTD